LKKCRYTHYPIPHSDKWVFINIQFSKQYFSSVFLRQLFYDRSNHLTWTTPGNLTINNHQLIVSDYFIKCFICHFNRLIRYDLFLLLNCGFPNHFAHLLKLNSIQFIVFLIFHLITSHARSALFTLFLASMQALIFRLHAYLPLLIFLNICFSLLGMTSYALLTFKLFSQHFFYSVQNFYVWFDYYLSYVMVLK